MIRTIGTTRTTRTSAHGWRKDASGAAGGETHERRKPDMSDIERIRAMAEDGTITAEEAERLIGILNEIDEAEVRVEGVADEAETAARSDTAAPRDAAGRQDGAASPSADTDPRVDVGVGPERPGGSDDVDGDARSGDRTTSEGMHAPGDLRWLEISTLAGDFDISVDPSLDAPRVDGPEGLRLLETEQGFALEFARGSSFLDRLLSGSIGRDFTIAVPAAMGVDLRIKAGDVDIEGVPYLRGQLVAGDLKAKGLRGIDLHMSAGDVDIWVAPTEGVHRITVTAGDLNVRFDPASDVAVEGRVTIGDTSVPRHFREERTGLGRRFSGTIGAGTASFELRQSTGDTKVSVEHA